MNKLFSRVFSWLAAGLFISFAVAFYCSTNENAVRSIFSSNYIIFTVIELILAFVLGLFIRKLSKNATIFLYIAYCITTGITLSSIFLVYKLTSIVYIFLITSLIFIALAIYGYKTEKDITKLGNILFFGLIGIIVITLINIFLKNSSLDLGISIIAVIVFTLYIAYDVNLIKNRLSYIEEDKLAVYGAFQLYLDFINLFIDLLRIFGGSRKD